MSAISRLKRRLYGKPLVKKPSAFEEKVQTIAKRFVARALNSRRITCPLCGNNGQFLPFGSPPRLNAQCFSCGSLERHRQITLLLQRRPDLIGVQSRVLHFAPEAHLGKFLNDRCANYETADISTARNPTHIINIEKIALEDQRFDLILCSHVLEHVDDRKALSELYRILKPGGILLVMVPLIEAWAQSYENPDITSPEERTLHFGQNDHVRFFGRDIRDRIRAAGFGLEEDTAGPEDFLEWGLQRGETIFLCHRREA